MDKAPPATSAFSELELLNIDPVSGTPPATRIKDVAAALSIYDRLRRADDGSAVNRARSDAMYDGVAPYDQKVLAMTGQGSRTNLNFGEAQRYLDISMSAFVDLYSSLECLLHVRTTLGEPSVRHEADAVIAEEATQLLREWPEFHSNYLRLCTEFTKHGVAVTYFPDATTWKFKVTGLGDFLIPRQTEASEECIEVACARRSYLLHELYAFIRNPQAATARGWHEDEVRRVMVANATTDGHGSTRYAEWESLQREMKNNDLELGVQNNTVSVVSMWVREIGGKISHFMFAEDNPEAFMFAKSGMFDAPEQAYVLFAYGVGTNGTYHSVRGQGQRIFPHIQLSNRMRGQTVDSAMLSGAVMIQPETERALEKLSFTMYGPYSVLSPDMRVIEKAAPDLTKSMGPALEMIERQLAMNADSSSTYGERSSPYRNELQVEHDLAVNSRLSGSTINLFYSSWSRLLREIMRRVSKGAQGDARVAEFYRRCAARGVDAATVRTIDHSRTCAVRAIGAGSAANRLLALRDLQQVAGSYDETGRRNLVRDITTERVGRDLVDRYAPPAPEPRRSTESKIAMLENNSMQNGIPVEVIDSEMHGEHLAAHAPLLQQLVAGIQSGEVDPLAALPVVEMVHEHCSTHNQYLAGDAAAAQDVAGMNQLLQQSEEVIVNFRRKIVAMQRKAAEAQMAGGGGPEVSGGPDGQATPSAAELKLEEHQVKQAIAQQKAQQEMALKQAKAEQDMAIRDMQEVRKLELQDAR